MAIRKNAKYHTDSSSLKLIVSMNKLQAHQDVRFAYRVLSLKGKKISRYITGALKHYENYYNDDAPSYLLEFMLPLKIAQEIRVRYQIENIDSLRTFLNHIDVSSYEDAIVSCPTKTLLLGFNRNKPEYFEKLLDMSMTERVFLVTKAVKAYCLTDQKNDPLGWNLLFEEEMVRIVKRYRANQTQDFIENLWCLMSACNEMRGAWLGSELSRKEPHLTNPEQYVYRDDITDFLLSDPD